MQHSGRESGNKMLRTLKQHGINALFALPTDFLKGTTMVSMVQEIRKGQHSVGFAFVPPKGKKTKDLNDSSITAELRTAKGRFKELYHLNLRYITFPHTDDQKELARLTKLTEAEGLVNVSHSLYLGAEVEQAKKSLLENVYQADSSSYIALIEGFGKDPSAIITELANRASEKYFKLTAFGRCVGTAGKRNKQSSKGPTFALTSLKCVGRVQATVAAKKAKAASATTTAAAAKKASNKSAKKVSKAKKGAAQKTVKPSGMVNPAFIQGNAKSTLAATKKGAKKGSATNAAKSHGVVNPTFIRGFRAAPKGDGAVSKKQRKVKRSATKMAAKRAKAEGEDSKSHRVKLHKRNKPVVPKQDTIMAAQKAAETGSDCKNDCNKTGVNAKTTKEGNGAASVTVSLATLLVSIAAGVALLI